MEVNSISAITTLKYDNVHKILSSSQITDRQKELFIRQNQLQISKIMQTHITGVEYKSLMKCRPLQKFKPLKNSFTKRGDRILLSNKLEIEPAELDDYIEEIQEKIKTLDDELGFLPKYKLDAIKTYVYRHGSTDGILTFLDYELSTSKDMLKTLYSTLEYHTGGLADYFTRPIHRLTNKKMVLLYNVINKNIDKASAAGDIDKEDADMIAKWALIKIYHIQNNNKLLNAIKTYKILSE